MSWAGNLIVSRLLNDDCEVGNAYDVVRRVETESDSLDGNEISFRPAPRCKRPQAVAAIRHKLQVIITICLLASYHQAVLALLPFICHKVSPVSPHKLQSFSQASGETFCVRLSSFRLQYSSINLSIES